MQKQAVKGENRSTWRRNGKRIYGTHVQVGLVQPGLIDAFALHLRLSGKAERTVEAYCCHVEMFAKSIPMSLSQVSEFCLRKYIAGLMESGTYSPYTITLKIRSLKRFYGYLKTTGCIMRDPSIWIYKGKESKRLPRNILSVSDMESVRESITGDSILELRNRAIVEVLYSTGLRLSEISGLCVSDIDFHTGILKIRHGKGSKERMAVVSASALQALLDYMNARQRIRIDELWVSRFDGPLCRACLGSILKKLAKKAGVTRPAHPHAWRHGVATALIRRGASIREVQMFLGHSSPRTTQLYTHVAIKDLQEIHQKTHPRANDPEPDDLLPDFSDCFPEKCRLVCYVCGQSGRREYYDSD